jgi:hypothetical protein
MKITEVPERCPICNGELTWSKGYNHANGDIDTYFDCKNDSSSRYACFYGHKEKDRVMFIRLGQGAGTGIKFCFDDKKTHIITRNTIYTFPFVDPSLEYSEVNAYAERLLKLKAFL